MKRTKEPITGEQLFLRYAWPCAHIRLERKKLDQERYSELQRLVDAHGQPERGLLEICFPDAVSAYQAYLIKSEVPENKMWSFESVAHYWRHVHYHPDKPVKKDIWLTRVQMITVNIVTVHIGGRTLLAENVYKLVLHIGDKISIHKNAVIELL